MSCAAVSPVFSPTREALFSKLSSPASSPSSSPSSSLSGALRIRLQKQAVGAGKVDGGGSAVDRDVQAVLKRKRPGRLDIPLFSSGFAEETWNSEPAGPALVEAETERFSVVCKRGRRGGAMEDRYSADIDIHGNPKQAFFGIFDGHGGAKAAEFAAENIAKNVIGEVGKSGGEVLKEVVKNGYLNTDMEFLKEGVRGGACCVTALIRNGDLVVSNAGDCRAVMSRGGVAEALSVDHRPSRDDERDRIQKLGGYVDNFRGVWRLQGSLAVSRGIGDSHLKQWVIAEPDTRFMKLELDCEFLILASDGLWDKVSNQEAVNVARPLCVDNNNRLEALIACKKLVNLSYMRGSADDISVMIIQLGQFL